MDFQADASIAAEAVFEKHATAMLLDDPRHHSRSDSVRMLSGLRQAANFVGMHVLCLLSSSAGKTL